jgi:hypothetical protein
MADPVGHVPMRAPSSKVGPGTAVDRRCIPDSRRTPVTLGPLEYIVIGFEGNRFDGSIAREVEKVVEKGIIRLVDVVFVTRDADGAAVIVELSNTDDPRFASFAPLLAEMRALFTPEDLEEIADSLPLGTSGLVLLFEHRWAEDLKDAIAAAGGFLVNRVVIPPEVLEEVSAELEAATASA